MYLKDAKELMKSHPDLEKLFEGCTEEEIIALSKILNEKIPEAFKEFLRWFGKDGGKILRGTDHFYRDISGEADEDYKEEGIVPLDWTFKKSAIQLLNKHNFNGEDYLANSIVFMSHQGYVIHYIKTDEGENPPVYIFAEQGKWLKTGPTKWTNSFSEYMLNILENEIEGLKKMKF